jgi:hypothetical protein
MSSSAKNKTSVKLLASVALVAAAAGIAGLGTYGTFTSTTNASTKVDSGTVEVKLGTDGTAANRLTVGAAGLVAGDSIQRAVQLKNTGDQAFAGVNLNTTATTSSILDTDATNGLQLTIESCSNAWAETAVSGSGYTYTCSGTTKSVLAPRGIVGAGVPLTNLASLAAGATDNLRVTMKLPDSADNNFQGKSSTVKFEFTATQRAATAK